MLLCFSGNQYKFTICSPVSELGLTVTTKSTRQKQADTLNTSLMEVEKQAEQVIGPALTPWECLLGCAHRPANT